METEIALQSEGGMVFLKFESGHEARVAVARADHKFYRPERYIEACLDVQKSQLSLDAET